MKKIVSILLILTLSLGVLNGFRPAHAESIDWKEVVLPNGELASADFSEGLNAKVWTRDDDEEYIVDDAGLFLLPQNQSPVLYQNFDYNTGTLKSDYYKFELELYINPTDTDSDKAQRQIKSGGLAIVSDLTNIRTKASKAPSQKVMENGLLFFQNARRRLKSIRDDSLNTKSDNIEYSERTFKYVIIMERIDDSNEFDVSHQVYRDGSSFKSYTGNYTANKIFPVIYGYKDQKAKIKSFKAYHVPQGITGVDVTSLKQKGDQMIIDWSVDTDLFERVKIVWSDSAAINFNDSAKVLYDGSSTNSNEILPLPRESTFYIGVQGYTGHLSSETLSIEMIPISPVQNVTYRSSSSGTGYTWDAVDTATLYDLKTYDISLIEEPIDRLYATLENIIDESAVEVVALKAATIGSGYSESVGSTGAFLPIGPVENLTFGVNASTINFNWDDKDDAVSYNLYRNLSEDLFVEAETAILTSDKSFIMNTDFVMNDYKVRAIVDGIMSDESNVVEVPNRVVGVNALLESGIAITWTPIGDAEGYNIYVSDELNMNDQILYTTSDTGYVLELPAVLVDKYIQVQAYKGGAVTYRSDVKKVDLTSGGVVVGSNISFAINGRDNFELAKKYYETPMTMDYLFTIGANELENPIIEIPLNHIQYPGGTDQLLTFIYPEVGDITMTGHGSLDHLVSIQSNGNDGYVIRIQFTEIDTSNLFIAGRTITVPIKTDTTFNKVESGTKSILYVSASNLYSWTELHLYIEEQWLALTNRLGLSESQASDLLYMESKIYYNRFGNTIEEKNGFNYEFKNRNEIPTQ